MMTILKPQKISQKVWLSIAILFIAYCVTGTLSFISKGKIRRELKHIGQSSERSTEAGHALNINIEAQMRSYMDAVVISETSLVDEAAKHYQKGLKALETLSLIAYNKKETTRAIDSLKHLILQYEKEATPVYLSLAEGAETDSLYEKSQDLAKRKRLILDNARQLTAMVAGDLANAMDVMGRQIDRQKWVELTAVIVVLIVSLIIVTLVINKFIKWPIQAIVENFRDIAKGEGDLTKRVDIATNDEMAELAKWFNTFVVKLQEILEDVAQNSETLNTSSDGLNTLAGQMASGADEMAGKSDKVSSAAGEMSSNMIRVAKTMAQSSTNINLIADSANEMTTTISEIVNNSEKARTICEEAVSQSKDASDKIEELGSSAKEIGNVTETISGISDQINLLALNATIEAARAGDSGKGFAVVANEIKELAKQTADSTLQIKKQIDDIQKSTSVSVDDITQISNIINMVNDVVMTITASIEEHSEITREIAGNVTKAHKGISDVNDDVAQNSTVAGGIAEELKIVNQSAFKMSDSSSRLNLSSEELRDLANQLKELVGTFKI